MVNPEQEKVSISNFSGLLAHNLVEAQSILDQYARERLVAWETDGIPPSAWMWSNCSFQFSVTYQAQPRRELGEKTEFTIATSSKLNTMLQIKFRYLPSPIQEEDEEEK